MNMTDIILAEDFKNIINIKNFTWTKLKDKTILITGANGFIPSYFIDFLLFLNDKKLKNSMNIIGVVRNRKKAEIRFSKILGRTDFKIIVQDVSEPLDISGKVDYIIHAASQASSKYYKIDPVGTLAPNILGTYHLLQLARRKKVRGFLYVSSGEVYGQVDPSHIPTKEVDYGYIDPINIRSCYAESKRMGENLCTSFYHQYKIPARTVRPFHTYGPGIKLDDGRVFADFISDIVHDRDIIMKSEGNAIRTFCYISDAISGFLTVLLKGKNGEAYNVSNDKGDISIVDLAHLLVTLFPEKHLKVIRQTRKDPRYLESPIDINKPDIAKLKKLGWVPKVSLEEGFRRTVRWFS